MLITFLKRDCNVTGFVCIEQCNCVLCNPIHVNVTLALYVYVVLLLSEA